MKILFGARPGQYFNNSSYSTIWSQPLTPGDAAKNQLTSNPRNTVFDAKRMIGRVWEDSDLQKDIKFFPFSTVEKVLYFIEQTFYCKW